MPEIGERGKAVWDWMEEHTPGLDAHARVNFYRLCGGCAFDPRAEVLSVKGVYVEGVPHYRLGLFSNRGWMPPTVLDYRSDVVLLRGAFGASSNEVVDALRTRRLRRHEGYSGIIAAATQYPDDASELQRIAGHGSRGSGCGVFFEVTCRSRWVPASGTWAEDDAVRRGMAAHNSKSKRWMFPEEYVTFAAVWVPCTGKLCDDLPGMMSTLDAP